MTGGFSDGSSGSVLRPRYLTLAASLYLSISPLSTLRASTQTLPAASLFPSIAPLLFSCADAPSRCHACTHSFSQPARYLFRHSSHPEFTPTINPNPIEAVNPDRPSPYRTVRYLFSPSHPHVARRTHSLILLSFASCCCFLVGRRGVV